VHQTHFIFPVYTKETQQHFIRARPVLHVESDIHPGGEWDTNFLAVGRKIPLDDLTKFGWYTDRGIGTLGRIEPYIAGLVFRLKRGQLVFAQLKNALPEDRHRFNNAFDGQSSELYEPNATVQLTMVPGQNALDRKPIDFDFFNCEGGVTFTLGCPLIGSWGRDHMLVQTCNVEVLKAYDNYDLAPLPNRKPWEGAFELAGFALAVDEKISQLSLAEEDAD